MFFLALSGWMLLASVLNGYGTISGKGGALVFNMLTVLALSGYRHDAAFWRKVARAARFVIVVHLAAWLVQLGYWVLTRDILDFLGPVTGEVQRVQSAKGLLLGADRVPRFAGLFSEPGTYANYIYILLIIRTIATRHYDLVGVLASVTMVLSMSLYGVLFALVYLGLYALTSKRKVVLYGALLGLVWLGIGAISLVYSQFYWRIEQGLGISGRGEAALHMLSQANVFLGLPQNRLTFPVEDLTLYIAGYATGGVVLLGGLLVAQILMLAGKRGDLKILLSTVFLAKLKLAYPVLWFVILLGIYRKDDISSGDNRQR